MLIDRRDQYQIDIILNKSAVSLTLDLTFVLNQANINSDGEYFFKFKNIRNTDTGELITDPQSKQDIADHFVSYFNKNTTNFIGLTISQISINI